MPWQKIDDQFGVSRKVTRLPRRHRLAAVGLWTLAANYSVRSGTDGVLDDVELEEVLATPALTDELVRVGLWHRTGHDCARCAQPPADGVVVHDFLQFNPPASTVDAVRRKKSEGAIHANHLRWHEKREVIDPDCPLCESDKRSDIRSPERVASDSESESVTNPPVPVPVPGLTRANSGPVSPDPAARAEQTDEEIIRAEAAKVGIRSLTRVRRALEPAVGDVSAAVAVDIARGVIALANEPVRSVDAYVEVACLNSPDEVRGVWRQFAPAGELTLEAA